MKMQLLSAAAAAALLFAVAPASAGPCSDEVASLEKALSSKDAGMGPTDTSGAAGRSSPASSDETGTPKAGQVPGTEATPAMNEAAAGKATSAQDVLKQNEGQPTAGDAAQGDSQGQTSEVTRSSPSEASKLLQEARDFDKAGKEKDCMAAIDKAKQQMGTE